MRHFYTEIEGWFNFLPLYEEVINNAKHEQHFVEIGAWKGKSTSYMAVDELIPNANKDNYWWKHIKEE